MDKTTKAFKVREYLFNNPSKTCKEVAEATELTYNQVNSTLYWLKSVERVRSKYTGRSNVLHYSLTLDERKRFKAELEAS